MSRFELTPFVGWVLLCRAHLANDLGRPASAEAWAREAVELARAAGDVDLELCATGELGTAFVESVMYALHPWCERLVSDDEPSAATDQIVGDLERLLRGDPTMIRAFSSLGHVPPFASPSGEYPTTRPMHLSPMQ